MEFHWKSLTHTHSFAHGLLLHGNRLSTSWVPGPAAAKTVDVHQELLQQLFFSNIYAWQCKWHVWRGLSPL